MGEGEAHTRGGRRAPKCFVPLFFFEENGVCRWHPAIQVASMFGKPSHLLFLLCEPQLDLVLELKLNVRRMSFFFLGMPWVLMFNRYVLKLSLYWCKMFSLHIKYQICPV